LCYPIAEKEKLKNMENEQAQQQKKKRKWPWVVGAILLLIIIVASADGENDDIIINEDNNVEADQAEKIFPGLTASDVYLNLEEQGIECDGPDVGDDGLASWFCIEETTDHLYTLEIVGENFDEILYIQATALYYGSGNVDEEVKGFLGFVASIPYEDSSQVEARQWVENNLGQQTSNTFGSAKFEIVSNARSRMLVITPTD